MIANLLTGISTPVWITIGVGGALASLSVVYGVFRKFVRMTWTSWQILLIFAFSLLLRFLPLPLGWEGFAITASLLFAVTAAVLISGAAIRNYMLRKTTGSNLFFRVCNRLLGAITSLLNFAMLAAVLGGFSLLIIYFAVPVEGMDGIFANPVWTEFGVKYIGDFMLVSVCVFFVRGGYRIGVARSIQTVVTLSLTLGALVLAFYLTVYVPFLRSWVVSLGGLIGAHGLNVAVSTVISYFIIALVCFLVFFAAVMVLSFFLNKLTRKYRSVRALCIIDGAVLSVIFFAFFLALVCGWNTVVYLIAHGDIEGMVSGMDDSIAEWISQAVQASREFMLGMENSALSSPLSSLFYLLNPFLLFF